MRRKTNAAESLQLLSLHRSNHVAAPPDPVRTQGAQADGSTAKDNLLAATTKQDPRAVKTEHTHTRKLDLSARTSSTRVLLQGRDATPARALFTF
ncbi:MAG: hypothetical protein A3J67_03815 [Parcubacteria group bacterium RIFCSPHIGHO2_02_FULL_48_10b]|nr:MAG: hypothetical protein A3J67_03815 [Parcubacteria group bacterium RIFCSPHIGHO2_02_FULL_48_10b]